MLLGSFTRDGLSAPYLIPSSFLMLPGASGQRNSGYWWNLADDR
jgi:hypothetical protein